MVVSFCALIKCKRQIRILDEVKKIYSEFFFLRFIGSNNTA